MSRDHVRVLPYGRQGHVFHLYARPLYAAIGEEDNRNRRPAEWDAVLRKLMTVDFVLAHPTARFWATEAEKVALLRERLIPEAVWPHRRYASRRLGGLTTIRYFVDKMPWYQVGDDARLWIAYVDTERTLQGFETFLDQYRALLASLPSGVTYVAPTVWHGAIQAAFTKTFESRDRTLMTRFLEVLRHSAPTREHQTVPATDARSATPLRGTVRGFSDAGLRCALPKAPRHVHAVEHRGVRRGIPSVSAACPGTRSSIRSRSTPRSPCVDAAG